MYRERSRYIVFRLDELADNIEGARLKSVEMGQEMLKQLM